jgi:hypothetical protein
VDRGDVELLGQVIRLSLTGSRGLATCALWISAIDKQKRAQWNELELLVRSVTKLQPHFITPWLFQSWNLAYNVSVGADRVNDKYFYITRGIELLAEGERQNHDHPDLRYWIGFYHQHKICKSDETNVQRSLFQLSLIPPNERDPARFKQINPATGQEEINWVEFEDFCKKHPQLVRRLHDGMMRDTLGEAKRQFTCVDVDRVLRFLADNTRVPSPYETPPAVAVGQWQKADDKTRPVAERFPPLPPNRNPLPPQHLFDPNELNADQITQLGDEIDAYTVARSWFAYAQEPIPDPDELPGSTKEIVDRARQRRPKQITTLIFRNHPALAQSNIAERLQQEGWFDNEPWLIEGWFPNDQFVLDKTGRRPDAKVGSDKEWAQDAWREAYKRWKQHGDDNHLVMDDADRLNKEQEAKQFFDKFGIIGPRPPILRYDTLDEETRRLYFAAEFMYENGFYRQVSNFDSHLNQASVESQPDTVQGRKNFYTAERLRWAARPIPAIEKYAAALPFWRDKVLLVNKEFRSGSSVQEESFDWQYRYLRLFHEEKQGKELKRALGQLAHVMPMMPAISATTFNSWLLKGPLDVVDASGEPLIPDESRKRVLARKPPMPGTQQSVKEQAPPPSSTEKPKGRRKG